MNEARTRSSARPSAAPAHPAESLHRRSGQGPRRPGGARARALCPRARPSVTFLSVSHATPSGETREYFGGAAPTSSSPALTRRRPPSAPRSPRRAGELLRPESEREVARRTTAPVARRSPATMTRAVVAVGLMAALAAAAPAPPVALHYRFESRAHQTEHGMQGSTRYGTRCDVFLSQVDVFALGDEAGEVFLLEVADCQTLRGLPASPYFSAMPPGPAELEMGRHPFLFVRAAEGDVLRVFHSPEEDEKVLAWCVVAATQTRSVNRALARPAARPPPRRPPRPPQVATPSSWGRTLRLSPPSSPLSHPVVSPFAGRRASRARSSTAGTPCAPPPCAPPSRATAARARCSRPAPCSA